MTPPPASSAPLPTPNRAGSFRLVTTGPEPFAAFLPSPLPPTPPLNLTRDVAALLDEANQALGRLDGVSLLLPDPETFIYFYVRKEAVLSSQIEGTQSSLSDLLISEEGTTPNVPSEDLAVTSNYVRAMNHGLTRIDQGFPLSLRLIREMHGILLDGARGSHQDPGEFRRTQNWIGGTRPGNALYVPPPADEVMSAMGALEKFLHDHPERTSPIVKAAMAHAQFESIHPFLDGNGRLGRLLITLILCAEQVLSRPLLYLSVYLKRHRDRYYEYLQRIRSHGDWEQWMAFFVEAVRDVAREATATTQQIVAMIEDDRTKLVGLGRATQTALELHDHAIKRMVVTASRAAAALNKSEPPVYNAIKNLEKLGILVEITGRSRNRIYAYQRYLNLLTQDAGS